MGASPGGAVPPARQRSKLALSDGNRLPPAPRRWIIPLLLGLLGFLLASRWIEAGLGFWGAGVCHRIVERSFVVAGRQLPLCARCTGLHVGFLVTAATTLLQNRGRPVALPRRGVILLLLFFLLAVGVDGVNSYLALFPGLPLLYQPHNTLRLLTGTMEGVALAGFFLPLFYLTLWQEPPRRRILARWQHLVALFLALSPVVLLALWRPVGSFYPLAILSLAGLFLSLGTVNTILIASLARRVGRVSGWRQALPLFSWGLLLALLEAALLAWLRYQIAGAFSLSLSFL